MEKGGLGAALRAVGITTGEHLAWADEMRVGLVSVARRVWAPVGVKALPGGGDRGLGGTLVVVLD
jgi:hypothetical protein